MASKLTNALGLLVLGVPLVVGGCGGLASALIQDSPYGSLVRAREEIKQNVRRDSQTYSSKQTEIGAGDYLLVINLANGERKKVWGISSSKEFDDYRKSLREKKEFSKGYIIQDITNGRVGAITKWKPN